MTSECSCREHTSDRLLVEVSDKCPIHSGVSIENDFYALLRSSAQSSIRSISDKLEKRNGPVVLSWEDADQIMTTLQALEAAFLRKREP